MFQELIFDWLQFNCHMSQPQNTVKHVSLVSNIRLYPLLNITDLDKTLVSFECFDGRTYDTIGPCTIMTSKHTLRQIKPNQLMVFVLV